MRLLRPTTALASALILALMPFLTPAPTSATSVVYLSAAHGSDSNNGSANAPVASFRKALQIAENGGTIKIDGGTYREGNLFTSKSLTFAVDEGETAVLSGAKVVTDWVPEGDGTFRTASANFVRFAHVATLAWDPTKEGMAAYPEQVFIDGKPLKQVATKGEVTEGTFWVNDPDPVALNNPHDTRSGFIPKPHRGVSYVIGTNPQGRHVEIVEEHQAMTIVAANTTINGLTVEKYSPLQLWDYKEPEVGHRSGGTAFLINGANAKVTNSKFRYAAQGSAVHLHGTNAGVFSHNDVSHNGGAGLTVNWVTDLTIERNTFSFNDSEGFKTDNCGGVCGMADTKITHADRIRYAFNTHDYSQVGHQRNKPSDVDPTGTNGLWFDEGVINSEVVGNHFVNVGENAVFDEVSANNIIASNIVEASKHGVLVSGTQNSKIYNNTIVDTLLPIVVREDPRTDGCNYRRGDGSCAAPERWSMHHDLSWDTEGTEIYNNVFSKTANTDHNNRWKYSMMVQVAGERNDDGRLVQGNEEVKGIDYNTYLRHHPDVQPTVIFWKWAEGMDDSVSINARSLDHFRSSNGVKTGGEEAHGHDLLSTRTDQEVFTWLNPAENRFKTSDLRPKEGGPLVKTGRPLNSNIAEAIGTQANEPVDRGALVNVAWE